jgi:hypothetical protein
VIPTLIHNRNLNDLLKDSAKEYSKSGMEYLHPMGLGIWNYIYEHLYKPIKPNTRKSLVDGLDSFQVPFTYKLYAKGGKMLTGTDPLMPSTLPGCALHDELEELVAAGIRPFDALRISTTNPFEYLGELPLAGTIEPGKLANLVLLDENPLDEIANTRKIYGVMTPHRWTSKEQIDTRMKEIRNSYETLRREKWR